MRRISAKVDWNLELAAITRKVFDKRGPALLFENIKDYEATPCNKLFTGGLATRERVSLMFGLSRDASEKDKVELIRKRFNESVKPVEVKEGPIKENILKGNDISLLDFPVPFWHPKDGGRFFNTYGGVVTRDPDTNVLNVGLYRSMVVDKNRISCPVTLTTQHWGAHYARHREMKEPMPVAIVNGWDPVLPFVACSRIPTTLSEYEVMGAIRGEPVELIKCETSDLMVPATAEIVVEGTISPDPATWEQEGPFGEYTGYYGGTASKKPVIAVKCITHRNDPIYRATLEGFGPGHPNEDGIPMQASLSAAAWNVLERAGVPGIRDVYALPPSAVATLAIQIKKLYLGHAKQAAMAVWGSGDIPDWHCKTIIVVEEDIDIHDFEALEWAFAYRVNAGMNDLVVIPGTHGSPLDPSTPRRERDFNRLGTGKWNRLLIDATRNWELEPQEQYGGDIYPPVSFLLDPEDERKVDKRWQELGLGNL